jgi:hypothetical protein
MSETIPRAPGLFRRIGMEWFYRLCREPRRLWRRYLIGNVTFLSRVFTVKYLGKAPIAPSYKIRGMFPAAPGREVAAVLEPREAPAERVLVELGSRR